MKPPRAFTLIELLVVIAIIGILSSVVLGSLNSARVKARDAARRSDLHQLSVALDVYANTVGNYPPVGASTVASDLRSLVPAYIPALPTDPTPSHSGPYGYRYGLSTDGRGYTLLANIEGTGTWCMVSTAPDEFGWSTAFPHC